MDEMMNSENEHLINIAHEIVAMSDSVIGITGILLEYKKRKEDDYNLIKTWFSKKTGMELEPPKNVIELRKLLMKYLRENGIEVPDDPTYETEQFNPRSNDEYFKILNDDSISGRSRR